MATDHWVVHLKEKRQLKQIKIPMEIEKAFKIKRRRAINVRIVGKRGKEYYYGPLRVTAAGELYLHKTLRETLADREDVIIYIEK